MISNGSTDLCVLHKCDNPKCVNPSHMFLGTRRDNNIDKANKGRAARLVGSNNPRATLDESVVIQIRALYGLGILPSQISMDWGTNTNTVKDILYRRSWKHL